MAKEIERKFLTSDLLNDDDSIGHMHIEQGYLAIEADTNREVRIRHQGWKYFLTVKSGQGLSRTENNVELDRTQFIALWPMTEGRRLEKFRCIYQLFNNLKAEVDRFTGALTGLILVEVEFPSEEAASNFHQPAWFGREVTDDPRFKNQHLATLTDLSSLNLE